MISIDSDSGDDDSRSLSTDSVTEMTTNSANGKFVNVLEAV